MFLRSKSIIHIYKWGETMKLVFLSGMVFYGFLSSVIEVIFGTQKRKNFLYAVIHATILALSFLAMYFK